MDAYSTVLWLNTLSGLKDWFGCLERLINRLESAKGSTKVVSELACDSAPMFKGNTRLLNYADRKGIVLLHSPPYTQKFNMVERSIRTVGEMSLAMARHANTPVPFMCYALMFAMPDGTVDVPLWRYKGIKVPLHLDRFHPFGCAVEAVLPKNSQARFAPKTQSCIFLGFDDNSLSYVSTQPTLFSTTVTFRAGSLQNLTGLWAGPTTCMRKTHSHIGWVTEGIWL